VSLHSFPGPKRRTPGFYGENAHLHSRHVLRKLARPVLLDAAGDPEEGAFGSFWKDPDPQQEEWEEAMSNRYGRVLQTVAVLVLVGFVVSCKTTSSPGRQVDDAAIKTAVKAKMAADVRLSTLTNIEVNSTNGIVTLSGQVANESDRAQAAAVARTVDGVVKVNNELQVKQ
jgi:hypothetical protein